MCQYKKILIVKNIINSISSRTEMNFQKGIESILQCLCEDSRFLFEKIEPMNGDGKNDGWIPNRNIFFACFSPTDAKVAQNKQIINKLEDDLNGLCKNVYEKNMWGKSISKFYLIVNTHDKNLPPDPYMERENKIKEIKAKFDKEFEVKIITTQDIRNYLLNEKMELLERMENYLEIDSFQEEFSISDVYEFIDDYTAYLVKENVPIYECSDLKRSTTINKIKINRLEDKKDYILDLMPKAEKIEQYKSFVLENEGNTDKYDKIRDHIINTYNVLKDKYSESELYNKILEKLKYKNMTETQCLILETIVVDIFTKCDIFEKEKK